MSERRKFEAEEKLSAELDEDKIDWTLKLIHSSRKVIGDKRKREDDNEINVRKQRRQRRIKNVMERQEKSDGKKRKVQERRK